MKLSHLSPCGPIAEDNEQSHMIERIVNLTLDMLYLLTGEDYIVLKLSCGRVTHSSSPCVSGGYGRTPAPPAASPSTSMKPDSSKNILELTSRIIELLTREEEQTSVEEQKSFSLPLKEEVVDQLISEDESTNRNPSERSPRPLNSRNGGEDSIHHQADQPQHPMVFQIKKEMVAEQMIPTRRKGRPQKRKSPERGFIPQPLAMSPEELHMITQDFPDINNEGMKMAESAQQRKEMGVPPVDFHAGKLWLHPSKSTAPITEVEAAPAVEEREMSSYNEWEISLDGSMHSIVPKIRGPEIARPSVLEEIQENPKVPLHHINNESFSSALEEIQENPKVPHHHINNESFSRLEVSHQPELHHNLHAGLAPFSCTTCGSSFPSSPELQEHLKAHAMPKLFACNQCGKCFTIKANLIAHRRLHMGDKPFTCIECGRRFALQSSLEAHLPIHAMDKPFPCPVCGKCFTSRNRLAVHQTTHTGDKSFECEDCSKTFTTSGSLNRHRKTHTGEKPFACMVCGRCFNREANLYRHQTIHTR